VSSCNQRKAFCQPIDRRREAFRFGRLADVGLKPGRKRLLRFPCCAPSSQSAGRDAAPFLRIERSNFANEVIPVFERHPYIADQDVGLVGLESGQRFLSGAGLDPSRFVVS
jgi:hypothetical protein